MSNPAVVLDLISDLYAQLAVAQRQRDEAQARVVDLEREVADRPSPAAPAAR